MGQCLGKTKSGSRCKRSVGEGSLYCAAHADQALGATDGGTPPEIEVEVAEVVEERDTIDTLVVAAALGAAALVVLAFGKLLRL
jgi:hypothetical protein